MTIIEVLEGFGIPTWLGTVIFFLVLTALFIVILRVGKIIDARNLGKAPAATPSVPPAAAVSVSGAVPEDTTGVTAAISASVNKYRKSQ